MQKKHRHSYIDVTSAETKFFSGFFSQLYKLRP